MVAWLQVVEHWLLRLTAIIIALSIVIMVLPYSSTQNHINKKLGPLITFNSIISPLIKRPIIGKESIIAYIILLFIFITEVSLSHIYYFIMKKIKNKNIKTDQILFLKIIPRLNIIIGPSITILTSFSLATIIGSLFNLGLLATTYFGLVLAILIETLFLRQITNNRNITIVFLIPIILIFSLIFLKILVINTNQLITNIFNLIIIGLIISSILITINRILNSINISLSNINKNVLIPLGLISDSIRIRHVAIFNTILDIFIAILKKKRTLLFLLLLAFIPMLMLIYFLLYKSYKDVMNFVDIFLLYMLPLFIFPIYWRLVNILEIRDKPYVFFLITYILLFIDIVYSSINNIFFRFFIVFLFVSSITFILYFIVFLYIVQMDKFREIVLKESSQSLHIYPSLSTHLRPSLAIYVTSVAIIITVLLNRLLAWRIFIIVIKNIDKTLANAYVNIYSSNIFLDIMFPYMTSLSLLLTFITIITIFLVYFNRLVWSDNGTIMDMYHPGGASTVALFSFEGCGATYSCLVKSLMRLTLIPFLGFFIYTYIAFSRTIIPVTIFSNTFFGILISAVMFPSSVYMLSRYLNGLEAPCNYIRRSIGSYLKHIHLGKYNTMTIAGQGLPGRILAHRLMVFWQEELGIDTPFLIAPYRSIEHKALECNFIRTIVFTSMSVLDKDPMMHTWCGTDAPDERYRLCYKVYNSSDTYVVADFSPSILKFGNHSKYLLAYFGLSGFEEALPSVLGDARYEALWSSLRPPSLLIIMIPHYRESLEIQRTHLASYSRTTRSDKDEIVVSLMRTDTATFNIDYIYSIGGNAFHSLTFPFDHLFTIFVAGALSRWIT